MDEKTSRSSKIVNLNDFIEDFVVINSAQYPEISNNISKFHDQQDKSNFARLEILLTHSFPINSISFDIQKDMTSIFTDRSNILIEQNGQYWSDACYIQSNELDDSRVRVHISPINVGWCKQISIVLRRLEAIDPLSLNIWCNQSEFDLIQLRNVSGIGFDIIGETTQSNVYTAYSFSENVSRKSRDLVGVALYENGAFGNCLIQYYVAISVARILNLRYIKVSSRDRSQVIDIRDRIDCGDIVFIAADSKDCDDGYFLSGMYFDVAFQSFVHKNSSDPIRAIVRNYVKKLFNRLPAEYSKKPDDQLIIHVRSGDIFRNWIDPNYPQPPLSFYKMVIQRLETDEKIKSVKLVFEDRLNPVIDELENYILTTDLMLETQSGSLIDDVSALVNGRFLVFGFGSFGPAICHFSDCIEQVFYFSSNWPQNFRSIESVGKVTEVKDIGNRYTKIGEWTNSEAQRQMMLEYPVSNLAFEDRLEA